MTMIALTGPVPSLFGISNEVTDLLRGVVDPARKELRKADTWNRLRDVRTELDVIYEACSSDNWDGYGALAVTAGAYREAKVLLSTIPSSMEIPEVGADPDGAIGFDWSNGKDRIFTLSVNGKGLIFYAGLLGKGNKAHGTEVFNDAFPKEILSKIERLYR